MTGHFIKFVYDMWHVANFFQCFAICDLLKFSSVSYHAAACSPLTPDAAFVGQSLSLLSAVLHPASQAQKTDASSANDPIAGAPVSVSTDVVASGSGEPASPRPQIDAVEGAG